MDQLSTATTWRRKRKMPGWICIVNGHLSRTWKRTVNLPHDSLRPLTATIDSVLGLDLVSKRSSVIFRCRATRISATIASTRLRPSSMLKIVPVSLFVRYIAKSTPLATVGTENTFAPVTYKRLKCRRTTRTCVERRTGFFQPPIRVIVGQLRRMFVAQRSNERLFAWRAADLECARLRSPTFQTALLSLHHR